MGTIKTPEEIEKMRIAESLLQEPLIMLLNLLSLESQQMKLMILHMILS